MEIKTQSALVENTLHELSSRPTDPLPPKMVAYLSYHFVGMEEAFHTLQQLRKQRIRTRLLIDDEVFRYFSKKEIVSRTENDDWITIHSLEKMEDLDHLFLPVLSFSLVASIISLNDQSRFVRFLLQSLFSGKKVTALSIGVSPNHPIWLKKGLARATPSLKSTLHTQLQRLKGFGVQLIEPEEALNYFSRQTKTKKRVYTVKDIEHLLYLNKKEFVMDQHTIMTPLALDILKQHQINLIRK